MYELCLEAASVIIWGHRTTRNTLKVRNYTFIRLINYSYVRTLRMRGLKERTLMTQDNQVDAGWVCYCNMPLAYGSMIPSFRGGAQKVESKNNLQIWSAGTQESWPLIWKVDTWLAKQERTDTNQVHLCWSFCISPISGLFIEDGLHPASEHHTFCSSGWPLTGIRYYRTRFHFYCGIPTLGPLQVSSSHSSHPQQNCHVIQYQRMRRFVLFLFVIFVLFLPLNAPRSGPCCFETVMGI